MSKGQGKGKRGNHKNPLGQMYQLKVRRSQKGQGSKRQRRLEELAQRQSQNKSVGDNRVLQQIKERREQLYNNRLKATISSCEVRCPYCNRLITQAIPDIVKCRFCRESFWAVHK